MAKYYVQSGSMKMVVSAEDPRRAALWAVHRALEQVLPLCEDEPVAEPSTAPPTSMVLSGKVSCSEKGFTETEPGAGSFSTVELVAEWSQLMVALSRMGL
jgi:hypothetical protein